MIFGGSQSCEYGHLSGLLGHLPNMYCLQISALHFDLSSFWLSFSRSRRLRRFESLSRPRSRDRDLRLLLGDLERSGLVLLRLRLLDFC